MIFFFVTFTCDIVFFRVTNRIKVDRIFTFACVCRTTFMGQCCVGYQIFINWITNYIWFGTGGTNLSAVTNIAAEGGIVVFVVVVIIAIISACTIISVTIRCRASK